MADIKKAKKEAIAVIDSALVILNKYPEFDETNINLSYNTSFNPFDFLMDVFKSTVGYDVFINIVSYFIAAELPAVEIAVKTVLLTNLRNIISCSLNPFIPYDVLQNGFVFDVKTIDMLNILSYCPLHWSAGNQRNVGRYYYFGCEQFDYLTELVDAGDFNAFLWYVINKSNGRNIWRGVPALQATIGDSAWGRDDYIRQKDYPDEDCFDNNGKCKKCAGVITLEYNERSSSMTLADGTGSLSLQTPFNNCLHVFIGNTEPWGNAVLEGFQHDLEIVERQIEDKKAEIEEINGKITQINATINDVKEYQEWKITDSSPMIETVASNVSYEFYKNKRETYEQQLRQIEEELIGFQEHKNAIEAAIKEMYYDETNELEYRTVPQNYYYNRTIIEFNTDYIMSLKLFDSKVVIAQLLDALTNCLSIDLNLSYEQIFVKNEVQKMVKAIIETDEAEINDCFFSFSNEEFNKMVQKSELIRAGLYTNNGEMGSNVQIDAEKILASLNEIHNGSTKEEIKTIISGTLNEVSKMVSNSDYELTDKGNFGIQMNFIENLLSNLAFVITSAVISPKLYLLIAINLQLLGSQSNFDLAAFIEMHKQMIAEIIRQIRDMIIDYLIRELKKIIGRLAEEIGQKIAVEQMMYYKEMLRRCIECFRRRSNYLDFNVGNIDYADIITDDEDSGETLNNEC